MKLAMATALGLLTVSVPVWAETRQPGEHFIENWDMDGDGAVSLEDITMRRGDVFETFDADENGALDAAEYAFFDEARAHDMKNNAGHGKGMRRASEGMTLAFNDADGNGEVSRAEFLGHAEDWLVLLDRNADGTVTPADFGRQ